MFSATHKMIADIVYWHVSKELGVKLDRRAFRYGCIAPDIKFGMRIIKHTRKGSYELVKKIGQSLILSNIPVTHAEMKNFSYKLGIINHFLCDYFCTPHNDERYKNIVKHLIYENKLKLYAMKKEDWNIPSVCSAVRSIMWENSSFEKIIQDKTKEYNNITSSFHNDMEFALIVSVVASLNIVKLSLDGSNLKDFEISGMRLIPV